MSAQLTQEEELLVLPPGIYSASDIPEEDYHRKLPLMSYSSLETVGKRSPAHLRWERMHPEQTDAMLLGSLTHGLVLEPKNTFVKYAVEPEGDGRTKEVKAAREAFKAEIGDRTAVSAKQFKLAKGMSAAIFRHEDAAAVLELSEGREQTLIWKDSQTELLAKGRLDTISPILRASVDVKSTACAHPDEFARSVYNYGYHRQGAFYHEGAAANGIELDYHIIIAVESEAPHEVCVYQIEPDALAQGRRELKPWKDKYAAAMKSGDWFGYPKGIQKIGLPAWAKKREVLA